MAQQPPLVVSVVLTWNDTKMTAACVESLLASDYPNLRVVLVDNGSDTPCGEKIKQQFPDIDLIVLPQNVGFSGGSNRGLEYALELDPDYVQLVGNDSTVYPNAISTLVNAMEARPEIGIGSPLLLYPGPDKIVQFYTVTVDRRCARHDFPVFDCSVSSREWPNVANEFAPFVAPMFRRKLLDDLGLLDESYGTSFEDFDYCIRTRDADWQIVTVGDSLVVHSDSQTTGTITPYITYFRVRNRLMCIFRHTPWYTVARHSLYLSRTFWWQVKRYGLSNWACHRAFVRGFVDFLLGVHGEGWAAKVSPLK